MSASRSQLRSFCTCSTQRAISRAPAKVHQKPPKQAKPLKPINLAPGIPRTELFVSLAEAGTAAISRRPTLVNEDAARDLVREWGIDKMHDAVVVEPFAGPGGISRALLELKNVKRVIAIEDSHRYSTVLQVSPLPTKQIDDTI